MKKEEKTFEQALARLEEIASLLEEGSSTLEESLKLYEEGAGLAAFCSSTLRNARQRIIELSETGSGDDGEPAPDDYTNLSLFERNS